MIAAMREQYPAKLACAALGLARSTYYYRPHQKAGDAQLLTAIEEVLMHRPYYGYRRITQQLKRRGAQVGERVSEGC